MKTLFWIVFYSIKNWMWRFIPFHGVYLSDVIAEENLAVNHDYDDSYYQERDEYLHSEAAKLTCYDCGGADRCPYAFDGYNTNGDCLNDK